MGQRISSIYDIEYTYDAASKTEHFTSAKYGFETSHNASTLTVNGLLPHTGKVVRDDKIWQPEITVSLWMDKEFIPDTTAWNPLSPGDLHDLVPWTHTTGPSNRRYVSPALRYALNSDVTKRQKGIDALMGFNLDQLNRPFSHQWLKVPDVAGFINKGLPEEWSSDAKTTAGWNAYDVAHNDCTNMFTLAALGHPLGLINMWLLWRWFISANPPGTNFWQNQPRCILWSLVLDVRAHMLGLGNGDKTLTDKFCKGWKPAKALREHVKQELALEVDPTVMDGGVQPDQRVMTVLKDSTGKYLDWVGPDGVHYGPEIWGGYGWQVGMRQFGYVYALLSGILPAFPGDTSLTSALKTRMDADIAKYQERSFTDKGMSWALSRHTFPTQAVAQKLLDEVNAQDAAQTPPIVRQRPYELAQVTSGWIIRERSDLQDCELHLPVWALAYGKDYPRLQALYPKMPKPGNSKYQSAMMDIVYAILET